MPQSQNSSLPIFDKFELQKRSAVSGNDPTTVNRKDYTKKILSRSVSNPCALDHNMRSHGAPSFVKNQLTFTGGVTSFIGEDPATSRLEPEANRATSRHDSASPYVGGLFSSRKHSGNNLETEETKRPTTADIFCAPRSSKREKSGSNLKKFSDESLKLTLGKFAKENGLDKIVSSGRPLNESLDRKVSYSDLHPVCRKKTIAGNANDKSASENSPKATSIDRKTLEDYYTKQLTAFLANSKNTAQQQAFLSQTGNPDIKDLVKDAVKEYFDSMNLPQVVETQRLANPEFQGYNEKGEEVWAVVKKDPFAEMMNKNASRPNSRLMSARSPMPNAFTRSKTQYWKDDVDFQSNLQNWASSAPDHEREIVKSLLKRLNGGQTPVEVSNSEALNSGRPTRRSFSGATRLIEPIQYQCDVSMFTKPPYNPSRHFIINPEWTSERYTVKKIPAAHLHPSASLKNKLGLLRS